LTLKSLGDLISLPYLSSLRYGSSCVLGDTFHKVTFGHMLRKVSSIREVLQAAIINSTVGQHLKNVAARAAAAGLITNSTEETRSGTAIIRQIADGIAFAGIF
jgi:hypothetical protein